MIYINIVRADLRVCPDQRYHTKSQGGHTGPPYSLFCLLCALEDLTIHPVNPIDPVYPVNITSSYSKVK